MFEMEKAHDPEKQKLVEEIMRLEGDNVTKNNLKLENEALFARMQGLKGQIELLCTENHNLKEGQKKAFEEKGLITEPHLYFAKKSP